MSEWQPARLRSVHSMDTPEICEYKDESELKELEAKVVRVRPCSSAISIKFLRRECDCKNGVKFYDVDLGNGEFAFVCEHEILTD